eukprot:38417_1
MAQQTETKINNDNHSFFQAMPLQPPPPPLDAIPHINRKIKKTVQLRIGSAVEVYSKTKQSWIDGKICLIKGTLICIEYQANGHTYKWLKSNSKEFRPKITKHKLQIKNEIQSRPKRKIKVKLHIGSAVEVYSLSNKRWINGKIIELKKDLIRIAYGKHFETKKWLKANSKQFRPKLDTINVETYIPKNARIQGAHITQCSRRELYEQFSVESIKGTNNKRGDLKIRINGALQLKNAGNFASITVAEYILKTQKVASDENPVWKEILTFSNFRPHIGKTGIISIGNKSGILGEKVIGFASFELPIVFNRKEKIKI